MSRILIYPGEVGELLELEDYLQAMHEEENKRRQREIDRRTATGAPLDGIALAPPLDIAERVRGVSAQFRVVSEKERRTLAGLEAVAFKAMRKALEEDAPTKVAAATDELFAARRAMLAACAVRVVIDGAPDLVLDDAGFDVLERNSLLGPLYEAASAFQELGPKKATRSGSSRASTSGASTAESVQSIAGAIEGAMVALSTGKADPLSLRALVTPPTPVPGGT